MRGKVKLMKAAVANNAESLLVNVGHQPYKARHKAYHGHALPGSSRVVTPPCPRSDQSREAAPAEPLALSVRIEFASSPGNQGRA